MREHRILMPERGLLYGYLTPLFTMAIFVVFIILSIVGFWYRYRADVGILIANDIEQLSSIFERIEKSCEILEFNYQQNHIDFLTIKKGGFVGSELGSMNMGHPENWDRPYLMENPTMQEK